VTDPTSWDFNPSDFQFQTHEPLQGTGVSSSGRKRTRVYWGISIGAATIREIKEKLEAQFTVPYTNSSRTQIHPPLPYASLQRSRRKTTTEGFILYAAELRRNIVAEVKPQEACLLIDNPIVEE
jgi:hypothetical protein